jgi:hypothetical protein
MAEGIIRLDEGWRLDEGHHFDQPPNVPQPPPPPVREYMARGMVGDDEIGQDSDIVSIAFAG